MTKPWLFPLVLLAACGPITKIPPASVTQIADEAELQRRTLISQLLTEEVRLQRISHQILTRSAWLCGEKNTTRILNAVFVNRHSFGKDHVKATEYFGYDERPKVAASGSTLEVDDEIVSLAEHTIPSGAEGITTLRHHLNQIDRNTETITATVLRNGQEQRLEVPLDLACDYKIGLTARGIINAFADGYSVKVDTGMMRFLRTDDELALVIGHEIAHNLMGHIPKKWGNFAVGSVLDLALFLATGYQSSSFGQMSAQLLNSQGFELEADYVGLYLTAGAGYEIDDAPELWRRMGLFYPEAVDPKIWSTHPSSSERAASLVLSVQEVKDKLAAGESLIPSDSRLPRKNDGPVP